MKTNIIEKHTNLSEEFILRNRTINLFFRQHKRDYQQDSYVIKEYDDGILLAIADGMGGHDNGDLASQETIKMVAEADWDSLVKEDYRENLANLAIQIDIKVASHGDNRGTTLIAAFLSNDNVLTYLHIGDSYLTLIDNKTKYLETSPQESPWGGLTNCIGFLINSLIYTGRVDLSSKKLDIALYSDGLEGANPIDLVNPNNYRHSKVFSHLTNDNQTGILVRL